MVFKSNKSFKLYKLFDLMETSKLLKELDKYNPTQFQRKVLIATMAIPAGKTKTYKQIAAQIGNKNAYRAVGSALKWNPLPIRIPCHRVVKSDGSLGNYSNGGKSKKRSLLISEGAKVSALKD
jgi:methylated-DNA-[protein]-cysteine S-methyltransferase